MYSLYRAWLLRDTASIASPSLSLPPDLIVTIPSPGHAPYQFIAHRTLVSSHSGYLKTSIAQEEQYGKGRPVAMLSGQLPPPLGTHLLSNGFGDQGIPGAQASLTSGFTPPQGVLEVTLPSSIQADTFSPLLTFMYTGYLDLNIQNIYELLLAVNILQMPHALDLCRSYLLHNVHSVASLTFNTQHLAKPIPGRGVPPPLMENRITDGTPPVPMDTNDANPVKLSPHEESFPSHPESHSHNATTLTQSVPPPPPINSVKRIAKVRRRRQLKKSAEHPAPSHRAASAHDSDSSDDVTVVTTERARPMTSLAETGGNTVIDIASCDGPVHFTRVLNENYDLYRNRPSPVESNPKGNERARSEMEEDSETEINIDENSSDNGGDENEENIARHLETEHSFQINFRHQIERQNRDSQILEDSAVLKSSGQAADRLKSLSGNDARVSLSTPAGGRTNQRRVIPRTVLKPVPASAASQREVRLLDMNVQYYPCKTCGAKFPSYYFVHKHRRRVHPEEEGGAVQAPNQSDEVDTSTGI